MLNGALRHLALLSIVALAFTILVESNGYSGLKTNQDSIATANLGEHAPSTRRAAVITSVSSRVTTAQELFTVEPTPTESVAIVEEEPFVLNPTAMPDADGIDFSGVPFATSEGTASATIDEAPEPSPASAFAESESFDKRGVLISAVGSGTETPSVDPELSPMGEGNSSELWLTPKSPGRPRPEMVASDASSGDLSPEATPTTEPAGGNGDVVQILEAVVGPMKPEDVDPESSVSPDDVEVSVVGPVPIETDEFFFGEEELEAESSPESSLTSEGEPMESPEFQKFRAEHEEPSAEPDYLEASAEPDYIEASAEPDYAEASPEEAEASSEYEPYPSAEPSDMTLTMLVQHPPQHRPEDIAGQIRDTADEFVSPDSSWQIESILPVSRFSKSMTSRFAVRQADGDSTMFELKLFAVCPAEDTDKCENEMEELVDFVRNEDMDKMLAAHDMNHVYVYIKGDEIVDRAGSYQAASASGMSIGVIAGIAVGGVAAVSLLVLGVIFAVKNRRARSNYDDELGYIDDDEYYGESNHGSNRFPEEEGSFLISNFGGTPRNTSGMIPWMNESSGRSGQGPPLNSSSFLSVDTVGEGDVTNNMSQYRFGETTSVSSDLDIGDLEVDDELPTARDSSVRSADGTSSDLK